MKGFVWVFAVGAAFAYVLASALRVELDPGQRLVVAYPAVITWAAWSVGYLLGPRRRSATLAVLARVSYRLRCVAVVARRRRRLAAVRDL